MELKYVGAALAVAGCTGFGLQLAAECRRELTQLEELGRVITYLENELAEHRTRLPALCMGAAAETGGRVRQVFLRLRELIDSEAGEDTFACMKKAIGWGICPAAERILLLLGQSLSNFGLPGQLKSLGDIRSLSDHLLDERRGKAGELMRCCRVLGICAGVSVAVLLL